MNKIILPRTHEGKPYISHSQANLWNDLKSFNLKVKGSQEYIIKYFFGKEFPDQGWGEFGQNTEDYICTRSVADKFNNDEKVILDKIEPLGVFQTEGYLNLGDFDVKLFIDDATPDFSKIRDYKTASDNSRKKYYKSDYYQMDIYGLWVKQQTKIFPEMELCIIERAGNCMWGKGRQALSVKGQIWYHTLESGEGRQQYVYEYLERTAKEISDVYKVFLKMNI